jgi:hypothetical protein
MLARTPSVDMLRRQMRCRICTNCPLRPPRGDAAEATAPRPCESTCSLFLHLPLLRKTVLLRDPMLASREAALRRKIDQLCDVDRHHKPTPASTLARLRETIVDSLIELLGRH